MRLALIEQLVRKGGVRSGSAILCTGVGELEKRWKKGSDGGDGMHLGRSQGNAAT